MKITWLGHSTFALEYPGGEVLLLDPWMEGNPAFPKDFKLRRVDGIAISHGHSDHTGSVLPIAKQFSPKKIVAIFELASILEKQGVPDTEGIGKGGTFDFGFAEVTAVNASHSSSYKDGDNMLYAGEPAGFIIRSEKAPAIYFAGDTCVFGDMALIAEIYNPEIAILPIGGHFTMDPHEAAHASRMLKVKQVIPMHYGTFPALTGTPDQLSERVKKDGIHVIVMKAGEGKEW